MTALHVAALFEHPIKSCAAVPVARLELDEVGPRRDRRWMVVDAEGEFVTQRTDPSLSRVRVRVDEAGGLELERDGAPAVRVQIPGADAHRRVVRVWGDLCDALSASEEADAWFAELLGRPAALVHLDPTFRRPVDADYGDASVSFADGFPLLVLSDASLGEIERRTGVGRDPRRFRPNLVIGGCAPFAEDRWRRIGVGDVVLDLVKPCSRCVMVNVDPDTGDTGREPLHDLAGWRRRNGRVQVGQNAIHAGPGNISVGDPVRLLEVVP